MNDKDLLRLIISGIISVTLILGGCIAANIINTQAKKELVKSAIEKGQNPIYIKCAMEANSSEECKTMMTVIAISKSDK